MAKLITGIQQIGIGIPNVHEAWKWYRQNFAIDVPIFEEAAEANLMLPYTGGLPHKRHAILALSMQGGGGFEIWQYTSRTPQPASFDIQLGDLGIYACCIKSKDIKKSHELISKNNWTSSIVLDPAGRNHFLTKDPYGNVFQVIEFDDWYTNTQASTGGVSGCVIGVSDIDEALNLYSGVLGYDKVIYDQTGKMNDWEGVDCGGSEYRRIKLAHQPRKGGFSQLLGPTEIELVQAMDYTGKKIYKDRFWGDLGFIHLCFDVVGMKDLREECAAKGFPFTVDSSNSFDMGEAAGHFSYTADPDGTLIEFVETHKIPIIKKIGWYLDMRKRDATKPLPKWMLKTLSFNRKKD